LQVANMSSNCCSSPKQDQTHPNHGDLLCYCFGISREDFKRDPGLRDFVVAKTKAGECSCETKNPSGRCCLKDFPKP
jgi:hypothetical protein